MTKRNLSTTVVISGAILLFLAVLFITVNNYTRFSLYQRNEIQQFLEKQSEIIRERIKSVEFNLALLSYNPNIRDSLAGGYNPEVKNGIRQYLSTVAKESHFLTIFLLDEDGNCIISTDVSFEGKNYGFRPYFKQAILNGSGSYVALGVTSRKLGLYLAKRVTRYLGRTGVLVVKLNPYYILKDLIMPGVQGISIWGCTESGILFSPSMPGFYKFAPGRLGSSPDTPESRQFEGIQFRQLDFSYDDWQEVKQKKIIRVERNGQKYYLDYFHLIPGTLAVFTVISEDFMLPPMEILKNSLIYSNCALLIALIPMIAGMWLIKRQYDELVQERTAKTQSEYRYRSVLKGNRDGFVVMNADTLSIMEANSKLYDLLGRDSKDLSLVGTPVVDLIVPEDRDKFIEKALSHDQKDDFAFSTRLLLDETSSLPVIIDFRHAASGPGAEPFCYAFIQDLRQGLRDAHRIKLLETAVEQSGSSIVITDIKGTIQYVNPAFSRVTGYEAEEALGQTPTILKSGKHDRKFYKNLWETILAGRLWHGRFCNKRKDGSLYWEDATIAPVQDESGTIAHFIAIKHDITRLVSLEYELNQKVHELESIMEHAGVGIAVLQNRKVLLVNSYVAELLGYSKEDAIGMSTRDFFYDSDEEYENIGRRYYPKLVKGETVVSEIEKVLPNGTTHWFLTTATAINPGPLESMKTVWVFHDITELKHMQFALEEAKKKAEEANVAKSVFLTNMSHEIRTPLNGVIGMLSLLETTSLDEKQKEYVDTAHASAKALLFLINDILDIAKIEAGKLEFDAVDFNLHDLLQELGRSFSVSARTKGLDFRLAIHDNVPVFVKGDPGRLRQILLNLVGNALKFTREGSIEIVVQLQENIDENRALIRFEVRDSGIGIPEDKLDMLFEKFSQVDSSISRKFGGTGLGLAISRNLVEMMDGTIGVESEYGRGSTFWFTVCLERAAVTELEPEAFDTATDTESNIAARMSMPRDVRFTGKVLVVEDNPVNQKVAVGLLNAVGIKPDLADNGESALAMMDRNSYDLVFMDIQMPVMDGIETTRRIRDEESGVKNRDVPVIALTAHAFQEEIAKCMKAGMNDYITKPVDSSKLITLLEKWLPCEQADQQGSREEKGSSGTVQPDSTSGDDSRSGMPDVFDADSLLKRTLGDVELAKQIIDMFIDNTGKLLEDLSAEIREGNSEKVKKLAHTIKGSAASVSAQRMSSLAGELELCARDDQKEQFSRLFESLVSEFRLFKENEQVNRLARS